MEHANSIRPICMSMLSIKVEIGLILKLKSTEENSIDALNKAGLENRKDL